MKFMLIAHAEPKANRQRNAFSNATGAARVRSLSPEQRNAYNDLRQRRGNAVARQFLENINRANAFRNA